MPSAGSRILLAPLRFNRPSWPQRQAIVSAPATAHSEVALPVFAESFSIRARGRNEVVHERN